MCRRWLIATAWILLVAAPALAQGGGNRPPAAQKTGQIQGLIDYCGPAGADGLLVHIFGTSFQSIPRPGDGAFTLFWVPPGTYSVVVDIPDAPLFTIENVASADNTITDLGLRVICRDIDGDGHTEDVDCNDLNVNINPDAAELCDGVDNDCDGVVDSGCSLCTDSDGDGFYAQAGCLTLVDCDDEEPLTSPVATEECDSIDNDCDGAINEGFDLATDPFNCGTCGNVCSYANATGVCSFGVCEFALCNTGFGDCNADISDGCEVDLSSDLNCGACANVCDPGWTCVDFECVQQFVCGDGVVGPGEGCDDGNQVTEACDYGLQSCTVCDATCAEAPGATSYCGDSVIDAGNGEGCDDGNQVSGDGCDSQCQVEQACIDLDGDGFGVGCDPGPDCDDSDNSVNPAATEICDGLDNNCDGFDDELFPNLGQPCDGVDADQCPEGVFVCAGNGQSTECSDTTGDIVEVCDGLDNDCDGAVDEGVCPP